MPKGNKQAKGQPIKPHKVKSIKLAQHLCPIVENSDPGITGTLEIGAEMLQFLAGEAAIGNDAAIGLLAKFGVEAQRVPDKEPIVVWRKDGTEAAWIV